MHAKAILGFLSFFSFKIPSRRREAHFKENTIAWEKIRPKAEADGLIERQRLLKDLRLGNKPADYNACEVIAACNVLTVLGEHPSFPEVIRSFEAGGLVFGGAFGTAPGRILRFFESQGIPCRVLKGRQVESTDLSAWGQDSQVFILTAFNDRDNIWAMVHTVCITRGKDGYLIHNGSPLLRPFPTLEEAVSGFSNGKNKPIALMGIGNEVH